jgi:signal transduction histidine kinase
VDNENRKRGKLYFPFVVFHLFDMLRSRFPIILVAGLLVLLSVLAFLQYRWLGQISDGERERLARSLQTETARFAEDFNREMQNAYFNFQLNGDVWRDKNWNEFNARREFWQTKTIYPNLIKNFYFVEPGGEITVLRFNPETKAFEAANLPENLENLKPGLFAETNFQPVAEEIPALLMPVREATEKIDRILIRTDLRPDETAPRAPLELSKKTGILIIELDENVIKNELFPNLAKKYFSESEAANYQLAVVNRSGAVVFQTEKLTATDANAPLFDLSSDNFIFFANRDALPRGRGERKTMHFSASAIETKTREAVSKDKETRITNYELAERANEIRAALPRANERRMEVQLLNREPNERPRVRVFEGNAIGGIWTLNVQHSAGSLEQFIAGARRKNLAVSFGILSLLGVSVVLIFVSAQRAKAFAQRQIDFVSSVSHEFRTPLAVIYSAGENLADGVAKEETQVSRYGNLIKGEGRKLTAMVEQILDYAGADSGRKKYDWREQNVAEIIENALTECEPLLLEKGFSVEKEIAANLPNIIGDKTALSRALQNLIVNSVKYSDGEKYLRISARNGEGKIKIAVEDKGLGIAKKDLPHIFEPFYRSASVVDEQIHGNGLGLSLVKQTVEAHKGELKVKSEIGAGSKFTIYLPLKIKHLSEGK